MAFLEIYRSGKLLKRQEVASDRATQGVRILLNKKLVVVKDTLPIKDGDWEAMILPTPSEQRSPAPQDSGASRLENYRLETKLGQGGMGVVWKGVQLSTKRPVAVKFLSAGAFASERARRRFEREVELSAKLEHPNIARIYDSGIDHGAYFFAMELIEGVELHEFVSQNKLSPQDTLLMMKSVCLAVNHAHQRGVIHRDLKPGNIMVSADGQPHVLDFGLAKTLLEDSDDSAANLSIEGDAAGTPAYMSPEQAAGHHAALDTRTDVYSLGVILYRLLTSHSPHDLTGTRYDVMRRIVEQEARPARQMNPTLDPELHALLHKALEHRPEDRYPGAADLAADIDRYLQGEPLTARPATTLYFLKKKLRKHAVPVMIAAVVGLALIGMAGVSYVNVVRQRNRADEARTNALAAADRERDARLALQANQERLLAATNQAEQARRDETEQRKAADLNAAQAKLELARSLVHQADALTLAGRYFQAKTVLAEAGSRFLKLNASALPADLSLNTVNALSPPGLLTIPGHTGDIRALAFSANGKTALIGSTTGLIYLWDLTTDQPIRVLHGHKREVHAVAFSPDGKTALSTSTDKTVIQWDLSTGNPIHTLRGHRLTVHCVAFTPDGKQAVSAGNDGQIILWDLASGNAVGRFDEHEADIAALAVTPDGQTIVSADLEDVVKRWNRADGKEIRSNVGPYGKKVPADRPTLNPSVIAFSPDGRLAVSSGIDDDTLTVWDATSGATVRTLPGDTSPATTAIFSPDAKQVLSTSFNGIVRVWDIASGKNVRVLQQSPGPNYALAISPDGHSVLSEGPFYLPMLWDLSAVAEMRTIGGPKSGSRSVAVSPDGRTMLATSNDNLIKWWDLATARELGTLKGHTGQVNCVVFTPDGRSALSASDDATLMLWDVSTGQMIRTLRGHKKEVSGCAVSPDGKTAISASQDRTLKLWDLSTGDTIRTFDQDEMFQTVAFLPDGLRAVSGGSRGIVRLWDVATGKKLQTMQQSVSPVSSLAVSPDGQSLLGGNSNKQVKLWNLDTGNLVTVFDGHTDRVHSVAFSPDGRIAASTSLDNTVKLWDLHIDQELQTLQGNTYVPFGVAFADGGQTVIAGSNEGPILSWDLACNQKYRDFQPRVEAAINTLQTKANDPASLITLGQWWEFRGRPDWAVDVLTRARAAGGAVSSLELGRDYWMLNQLEPARSELVAARSQNQAPADYLDACIAAIDHPATQPTTRP